MTPPDASAGAVEALLACPPERWPAWLAAHPAEQGMALLHALKQHSDARLISDPPAAERASRCAQMLASLLPHEPLAAALACWARGNWAAYHDPLLATQLYQQALGSYGAAGDALSAARLHGNLVFAYADCGQFGEAERSYHAALAVFGTLGDSGAFFVLRLEQNYGWLLYNQGRPAEALATYERALALAERLAQPVVAAEVAVNRALAYVALDRLPEAEGALLAAHAAADQHGQALTSARVAMNLGELYAARGRPAEALRWLQQAQAQFGALGNTMEAGSVLLRRSALLEQIGALREARRSYAQAIEHFSALSMQPQVGIALVRAAAVSRLDGAYPRAQALLDRAEALWDSLAQPQRLAEVAFERGWLALDQSNPELALALADQLPAAGLGPLGEARRDLLLAEAHALRGLAPAARAAFERVLSYAQQQGDRWLLRRALAGLGRLMLQADSALARQYLEAAADQDDTIRQELSVEELKASFQARAGELVPTLAQLAAAQGRPLDALGAAWRAKGSALLDLLERAACPAPADGLAEIELIRRQLAARRWQLAVARSAAGDDATPERDDETIRALEQRLFLARERRNYQARPGVRARLADPAQLLARMPADLLIEYLRCGDQLLALRADRAGSCQAVWLGDIGELLDLLDALQLSFQNVLVRSPEQRREHRAAWLAECRPLLGACYQRLLAPLGPIPAGAQLLLAPCAPLDLLPFAALWDGTHYLAERCTIGCTPSAALLAAPPAEARAAGPPLIIAASAEQRLAAVEREVAAIHRALPVATSLVDTPGALEALQRLSEPPRILHLAAHSVLRDDAPIFSALQLSGALLSVEQCYELPLAGTELVTLSACATASGLETGGALLAFQSAFLIAGAHNVLSSLWPIDDAATATFMLQFYGQLAAGLTPPAALRAAQRALMRDPASDHPAIWAPFICTLR